MPQGQVIEVPIDLVAFAANSNKSPLIPVNNAQRVTLEVQSSAPLSAGQWVLKSALTPNTSIPGAVVATANFSATARVMRAAFDACDKWVWGEQITGPTGGTVEKISVFRE
jgi:hypothetical protein